jgi:hypothetical protein
MHGGEPNSEAEPVTGYLHPHYPRSLAGLGTARELPRSGSWVLERPIERFPYRDAAGCYPLFCCRDWSRLHEDLDELADDLVCLTVVTDPFGDYDELRLRGCFPDLVIPFKRHYVVDLHSPPENTVSRHHRKCARRALRELAVHVHPRPAEFIDEWMGLYQHLMARHRIGGIKAFPRPAFAAQLATPGAVVLRVTRGSEAVAGLLFFLQGEVAHGHVLACTDAGYRLGALYAGIWFAIEHFPGSARWLNLMGVPGLDDAAAEGIHQFKRGWTRETRMAWLCGRIFNRTRYMEMANSNGTPHARYFPAYRAGERA